MKGRSIFRQLLAIGVLLPCLVASNGMTLNGEIDHVSLNSHITYLVDGAGEWGLEQALRQKGWQENTDGRVLNFGFTRDRLWIKTSVSIPEAEPGKWYVVIPYPLLEQVDLYLLEDGAPPAWYHVNRRQVLRDQGHLHGYHVALPLPASASGHLDIVLRAQTTTSMQVPLALWREEYLHSRATLDSILWGGYFGVLVALVVYNLFLFASIRDKAYGYYVLYLASLAVLMLCISGVGVTLLWPQEPVITRYVLPISTALLSLFAVLFARAFLKWPGVVTRRLEQGMKTTIGLALLLILYTVINPIHGALLAALLGSLVLVMLISAGFMSLRSGVVIARYFVAAWASFMVGSSLYLLNVFGVIAVNAFTNYAMQLGSVAEVLLLSFALAHRIKEERLHKIAALEKQHDAEQRIKEMELEALERALHDAVTKMPNAALLNHRMNELLPNARQLALVIVHYPQVRQIALSMGHSLAETTFRKLMHKLNTAVAESGLVVCLERTKRAYVASLELGSAAFLIEVDREREPIETRVARLVCHYEISVNMVNLPTQLNMHCGIAIHPDHGSSATTLYQYAWAALDSSARSQLPVQVYSQEISAFAERRLALMSALLPALEAGEIAIYLQPQMDCATGVLVGAEVLLRWHSPEFGQVPTWEAIEIAENASLMDHVTRFVVNQSFEAIRKLRRHNLQITFSINVSAQNLKTPNFIHSLMEDVNRRSIPTSQLILEVTETAMMQDMDTVVESLLEFTKTGGKIALDDFGTGYSSLAYLSRLPIHELKIDNSFIKNMRMSRNDLGIVENTIKLARTLRLETVAEGIEDREALRLIRQLGCDRAQGYYFSRPIPVEAFCRWALQRQIG